jgi:hypothetical protein
MLNSNKGYIMLNLFYETRVYMYAFLFGVLVPPSLIGLIMMGVRATL